MTTDSVPVAAVRIGCDCIDTAAAPIDWPFRCMFEAFPQAPDFSAPIAALAAIVLVKSGALVSALSSAIRDSDWFLIARRVAAVHCRRLRCVLGGRPRD